MIHISLPIIINHISHFSDDEAWLTILNHHQLLLTIINND